jgi:hypothetical protein
MTGPQPKDTTMTTARSSLETLHAERFEPPPARWPRGSGLALSAAIAAVALAVPRPAHACIPDPTTGKCVAPPPTSHPYQVTGADSQGLAVQATPHIGNVIRWATNGTTLNVVCQVNNGDQADGRTQYGRPFRTWDQLNDGNFVYDWYMNTPTVGTDGYSPGIAHCPGSNPQPPGGGAGTYQVTGTDSAGLAVHSVPALGGVLQWVPNGTSLTVSCQINDGAQVDGRTRNGQPFTTWDQLTDGTWVYDWYMTTPVVGSDGFSPGMPHCQAGGFTVWPTDARTIHLAWTDATHGNATYSVTDEVTVRTAGQGVTSYDWTGIAEDKTVCFKISSALNGYVTPWSAAVCTTTPRVDPWCPSQEPTHPSCSTTGAFQASCPIAGSNCTSSIDDFHVDSPGVGDDVIRGEAIEIVGGFATLGWNHAADFLANYLNAGGADWAFSSVDAYHQGPGFKSAVDAAARHWIGEQRPQDTAFDSGYIDFPSIGVSTDTWGSDDWKRAVGHGFFRLVGARQASGAWTVQLQLTSYYQFRSGEDFDVVGLPVVSGAAFRHLHEVGYARNFREIGTGTLSYGANGSPL